MCVDDGVGDVCPGVGRIRGGRAVATGHSSSGGQGGGCHDHHQWHRARAFKLLPPAARGDAATSGIAWLKTYTASPEFKQQYAQIRQTHKPLPPEFTGTPEDEITKADEEQKRKEEESTKALAALPADQRAQIEQAMKAAQAQMNTPEMHQLRLNSIKSDRAQRTKEYDTELAQWQSDFPESPTPVIVKRLREFLAASADVDFAAKVVTQNGQTRFVSDAYERKPREWKFCFRAGKEATGAARTAAQTWLKELGG